MFRSICATCRIPRAFTHHSNCRNIQQPASTVIRWQRSLVSRSHLHPEVPADVIVDEERIARHNFHHFYPANPGDVLLDRFKLISKIGWGTTSTVWLAGDNKKISGQSRYYALKICNCDTAAEHMTYELDMNRHLSSTESKHRARGILCTAVAGGEIESKRGDTHLVLVFEPLREPLWLFRGRISQQDRTTLDNLPLFKAYIRILLEGLEYMHTEAKVIHTDFKLDNIMVAIEDPSTIEGFVKGQESHPMARKTVGDYTIYRCHNDFGPIYTNNRNIIPYITDFGLAQHGNESEPLVHPIQPDEYRAPEVILGTGWSYSADMWNFGAMIWDLLAGRSLFEQRNGQPYSAAQHLADMISLLGDAPESLISREREMRNWNWSPAAMNADGKLCSNAAQYYGGPFFHSNGTFTHPQLISRDRSLDTELPECIIEDQSSELFLKFMRRMLCWVSEERATAAELLGDPWLKKEA